MTRLAMAFVGALLAAPISGCFTGPSAGGFGPAMTGHGIDANLRLRQGHIDGELLEVSDSSYVLLNATGLSLVMFSVVRGAKFPGIGSNDWGPPDAELKERLRLVSRYPQGIPRGVLGVLLADAKQTELHVVQ